MILESGIPIRAFSNLPALQPDGFKPSRSSRRSVDRRINLESGIPIRAVSIAQPYNLTALSRRDLSRRSME